MKKLRKIAGIFSFFMLFSPLVQAADAIRIADATPAGDAAVRSLALQLMLDQPGKYQINIERLSPKKALNLFNSGEIDLVLINERELPQKQKIGIRHFYAAEAAVFYVNPANPLNDATPELLIKLFSGPAPDWSQTSGRKTKIYRLGLRRNAVGYGLPERMLKVNIDKFDQEILRLGSNAELQLLTSGNTEALGAGIFSEIMPDTVKTLKINGVAPLIKTIKEGSYPLTERYILLLNNSSQAVGDFVELMHGADFRRYLKDSGRMSLLP